MLGLSFVKASAWSLLSNTETCWSLFCQTRRHACYGCPKNGSTSGTCTCTPIADPPPRQ
jgi:hypothetical protein